ncbi:MAG: hypothetical protein U9Q07_05030, partial [Planctomycetota bacterium]|nr:hypothetical protein [Planctomycetota bacterium]
KTVEEFHTKDLAYNGGFYGQADAQGDPETVDIKIWVDVNTFLPVRSEETITMKDGRHIREVSYDFQWNVAVTADDFKPVVPEAYDTVEFIIPEANEEAAIKGLSLFADLAGTYPTDLNKKRLDREAVRLLQFPLDPEAWKALTEQERNELTAKAATITVLGVFYRTLVEENKEPAYFGESVRSGDTEKVLLRWKLGDGRYRIIFGDLHADTVTADVMIELETALPK